MLMNSTLLLMRRKPHQAVSKAVVTLPDQAVECIEEGT